MSVTDVYEQASNIDDGQLQERLVDMRGKKRRLNSSRFSYTGTVCFADWLKGSDEEWMPMLSAGETCRCEDMFGLDEDGDVQHSFNENCSRNC